MSTTVFIPILDRLYCRYARMPDHPAKIRIMGWLRRLFRIHTVVAKTPFGMMRLGTDDYVQTQILIAGGYELHTLKLVLQLLQPGDCFLDIGANVGQYALAAAGWIGTTGQVIAVEPNPEICADLLHNVGLNRNLARIHVVLAAAAEKESLLGFSLPPPNNRGMSRESSVAEEHEFLVAGARITRILERLLVKKVDVVKIDVEGSEMRVLKGLLENSTFCPKHIIFEFIPDRFSYGGNPMDILSFLENQKYEILKISGVPYNYGDNIQEENLWARMRSESVG